MNQVDRELLERLEAAYDENGVDRSQIRERLKLLPEQRLLHLEEAIDAVRALSPAPEGSRDELSSDSGRSRRAPG